MAGFDPNAAARPDSGVFGLDCAEADSGVVLVPVPFAATVSYGGGAELGPAAILAASHQVDLYDLRYGRPYEKGICWQAADPRLAAAHARARPLVAAALAAGGDPDVAIRAAVDAAGAEVNAIVQQRVAAILAKGQVPGVVGGDHAVPFGAIQAVAERYPGVGILHFDAHADLRVAFEGFQWSHASIMDNVLRRIPGVARLVQIGIRDFCEQELQAIAAADGRVVTHFDAVWQRRRFQGVAFDVLCREAVAALPQHVYVSFDIDGLDPACCPNTGTPVPGGLSFAEALHVLEVLHESGRHLVGFDLVEVAPGSAGEWDANVGARLLYKLCGAALANR